MHISLLTILFACLLTGTLSAQTFIKSFADQNVSDRRTQLAQTGDGGFIMATEGTFDFLKLDANGDLQWTFIHPNAVAGASKGMAVFADTDTSMILGGTLETDKGFVTRVDLSGNIIWDEAQQPEVKMFAEGWAQGITSLEGNDNMPSSLIGYSSSSGGGGGGPPFSIYAINGMEGRGPVSVGGRFVRKHFITSDIYWEFESKQPEIIIENDYRAVVEAQDSFVYALAYNHVFDALSNSITKIDPFGNLVANKRFSKSLLSITELPDHTFLLSGSSGIASSGVTRYIAWLAIMDSDLNLIWEKCLDASSAYSAIPTADGGIAAIIRNFSEVNSSNYNAGVIKLDASGFLYPQFLAGTIYIDKNDNCIAEATDSLVKIKVIATNLDTEIKYFGFADSLGQYIIDCPPGEYEITTNFWYFWEPCAKTLATAIANSTTLVEDKVYKYNSRPRSIIQGQAYIDLNNNCIYDDNEPPMACIEIRFPIGILDVADTTDQNGFYEVDVSGHNWYNQRPEREKLNGVNYNDCGEDYRRFIPAYDTVIWDFPLDTALTTLAYVSGNIFADENDNCLFDSLEFGTDNFEVGLLAAGSTDTIVLQPNDNGFFHRLVTPGTYDLFPLLNGNLNWESCQSAITVDAQSTCDNPTAIPLQAITYCSEFEVSIGASSFRVCSENLIYVNYQNIGSELDSALIEVVLDTLMTYVSSTIPPVSINGDTLFFIGPETHPFESGSFHFTAFLDCDAVNGETHCVEATVDSNDPCPQIVSPSWDNSSVQITGSCVGDMLDIKIENIGDSAMTEVLEYIVIEDNLLLFQNPFQLEPGEFFSFQIQPNGASIHIDAEQSANHPGRSMPARSFEGCGENESGSFSLGYITQYPQDDANINTSIFCLENVNSYDPNDKQGFPRGITEAHFIDTTTQLEYMIRFQNTGTAPALKVVITDEISEHLNPFTIVPGASSHNYIYELIDSSTATFTFDNINLPDSSANLEASQGFILFTIDQYAQNPMGTIITNEANIYFDSNDPILTNETLHQIPFPEMNSITALEFCVGDTYNENILNQDTSIITTTSYALFDSLHYFELTVNENYFLTIDTFILAGATYQGVIYNGPATLVDSLYTQFGCDSIIITNLDILTNTEEIISAETQIQLIPNPTTGKAQVIFRDQDFDTVYQFCLYDNLGKKIIISTMSDSQSSGSSLDFSHLPGGIYFLQIKWAEKTELIKMVKM